MAAGKKTTWRWVHLKLSHLECKSAVSSQVMRSLKTSVSLTWPKNEWHLVRSFDWGTHIIYIYPNTSLTKPRQLVPQKHESWTSHSKPLRAVPDSACSCWGRPHGIVPRSKDLPAASSWNPVPKAWRDSLISSKFQPSPTFQANDCKCTPLFSMNFSGDLPPPCSSNHHVFSTAFDHGAS